MGRISSRAGKIAKHRFSVPVWGFAAAAVGMSFMGADGDPERAGENMRRGAAPVVAAAGEVAINGVEYVDGMVPAVNVNTDVVSFSDGSASASGNGSGGVEVQAGEGWQSVLMRGFGLGAGEAMDCYNERSLGQITLYAGNVITNPCD